MKKEIEKNILGVVADFDENLFDELIDNEVVKAIPIVKLFAVVASTSRTIQDRLFAKKLWSFVKELDGKTAAEVTDQIIELDKSHKNRIKTGEKLLYLIDESQTWEVSEIISKLFKATLEKKMSPKWFTMTSELIAKSGSYEIKRLQDEYREAYKDRDRINVPPINTDLDLGSGFYYLNNYEGGPRIFIKPMMILVCKILDNEKITGMDQWA